MIGQLPKALEIAEKSYPINADFRVVLNIFAAFNDPELTDDEKCYVCIHNLYADFKSIPKNHYQEAVDKAYWFLNGGQDADSEEVKKAKIFDWEQDERLLFPAINKAAGYETRAVDFLHWWSFLGLFGEIGEGLFSQVLHIRQKRAKGRKLEKYEEEFLGENRDMIILKQKYSAEEQAKIDALNALLG